MGTSGLFVLNARMRVLTITCEVYSIIKLAREENEQTAYPYSICRRVRKGKDASIILISCLCWAASIQACFFLLSAPFSEKITDKNYLT
mmetsp:Transcript_4178/g.8233  ORF Transcript_4178/g.8233 Transcript_4178/m.8233 type:complete len:89 (+) Transcript_4178:1810-2076(+)